MRLVSRLKTKEKLAFVNIISEFLWSFLIFFQKAMIGIGLAFFQLSNLPQKFQVQNTWSSAEAGLLLLDFRFGFPFHWPIKVTEN